MAETLGTDPETRVREVKVPSCTMFFEPGEAIRVEADGMETVSIAMIERASMILMREVMKHKQKLSKTRPETHEAGWAKHPEMKHVA